MKHLLSVFLVTLVTLVFGCTTPSHKVRSACADYGLESGAENRLIGAAGSGELAEVKQLLAKGANVNFQECDDVHENGHVRASRGWTPLIIAAGHGHLEVMRVLIAAGAKVDVRMSDGASALEFAQRSYRTMR